MEMYNLTPKQINELDEIIIDKTSAEQTLKIALNFHSNKINNIIKKEKEWWDDLIEIHKLSKSKNWMVDFKAVSVCIREKTEDD